MKRLNILITGVGGPTPRSFAIALKKYGKAYDYHFIATDTNPLAIGLYQKDLFDEAYVVPRGTDPDYWSAIENIVRTHEIDLAVILPEVEVVEWAKRQASSKLPCKVLLPDEKLAELLVDKAGMTHILSVMKNVPRSIDFDREHPDWNTLEKELGYPFWVRSSSGTSGLGSLKVSSKEDLKNWITINPGVKKFLASEYLPGRNLACKLLYWQGKLVRAACAERVNYIMSKVAPSGITGNTSFGRLINEPDLVQEAKQALEFLFSKSQTNAHGFFTVDFKEDVNQKPFITEINVRHVAFTQCFAAGGANFAEDTIRLQMEDKTFEKNYEMYQFEEGLIFLRDVDTLPILMKEHDLLRKP